MVHRRLFSTLGLSVIVVAILLHTPAPAQSPGCGVNAYIWRTDIVDNRTIHRCRCRDQYDRYLGACIKKVCAQAFNDLTLAREGGRQALIALRSEAVALAAEKVLRWIEFKGGPATRIILYIDALADADSGLDELLAYYLNHPPSNDSEIWNAIKTLNNFKRLVKATQRSLQDNNCVSE